MAAFDEFVADWRAVATALPEGVFEPITVEHAGREYEVMRISRHDPEIDRHRHVARTPSRKFDDKVARIARRTRDTMLVRYIEFRGTPRYVLEPGEDVIAWFAALEGMSEPEFERALRSGKVWALAAKRVRRRERRLRDTLQAEIAALGDRLKEVEEEAAALTMERNALGQRLARLGSE